MYCENCGNQILDENKPCSSCGQMPEKRYDDGDGPKLVEYPMKWFKFLIYFNLIFGALGTLG
ncbi:MAG: zinc ribbon domain-containing protein, partial [Clostridia bacterium]|nr:zinc ribbon domain-containing protein [Clostridia bacterium]